jgi:hypothetical protein
MRLDIPAGTAVRFEPGEIKTVRLVAVAGRRQVYGGSGLVDGPLDDEGARERAMARLEPFLRGELPGPAKAGKTKKGKK